MDEDLVAWIGLNKDLPVQLMFLLVSVGHIQLGCLPLQVQQ